MLWLTLYGQMNGQVDAVVEEEDNTFFGLFRLAQRRGRGVFHEIHTLPVRWNSDTRYS